MKTIIRLESKNPKNKGAQFKLKYPMK